MLDLPRYGNINVHGSLLPKYRGAAPIQWAVANGETETGVTTMLLDAGLDTGNTLLSHSLPIGPDTTSPDLYPQLSQIGANLLLQTLSGLEKGTIVPQKQDDAAATLAPIPHPRRWPPRSNPQGRPRNLQSLARLQPLARSPRPLPRQALPHPPYAPFNLHLNPSAQPAGLFHRRTPRRRRPKHRPGPRRSPVRRKTPPPRPPIRQRFSAPIWRIS